MTSNILEVQGIRVLKRRHHIGWHTRLECTGRRSRMSLIPKPLVIFFYDYKTNDENTTPLLWNRDWTLRERKTVIDSLTPSDWRTECSTRFRNWKVVRTVMDFLYPSYVWPPTSWESKLTPPFWTISPKISSVSLRLLFRSIFFRPFNYLVQGTPMSSFLRVLIYIPLSTSMFSPGK